VGFWDSATLAGRLRESGSEGAEHGTWVEDLLGGTIGVYGLPTDTGADLSVVHLLRPIVELEDLWAVLPKRLEPFMGPLGGVEVVEQDGASLLTVSSASPLMSLEVVATHDGQTIFVAGSPAAALLARAHAIKKSADLLGREELSAIQDLPAAKIARVTWFDAHALLRPGHAALHDLLSMLEGMSVELGGSQAGYASLLPPVEAMASGPRSWLWIESVQEGDLVLDAPLDRSLTRTAVVLSGVVLTHPWTKTGLEILRLITPVSFDGAQRTRVSADLRALRAAIDSYALMNSGRYPDDLRVLVTPDELGNTYLKQTEVPTDPWGREYLYDPPKEDSRARAYTLGADGEPGGWGEDADLSTDDVPRGGRFGGRRNVRKKRDD